MMQLCQRFDVQRGLRVQADIGTEGWAALGMALSGKSVTWLDSWLDSGIKSVPLMCSDKEHMASARGEDLKAIWEGVNHGWEVWLDEDRSELFEDWTEFEEFLKAEEDAKENEDEGEDKV